MSDPRETLPHMRKSVHSPLMQALKTKAQGEVVNFCPFGCTDQELDQNGYCGHLIGFYNEGKSYEPRVVRADGRIITSAANKRPMRDGFVLVRITTTARVYSPKLVEELVPPRESGDDSMQQIIAEERELLRQAEKVRNPVLEGVWKGDTVYDSSQINKQNKEPKK